MILRYAKVRAPLVLAGVLLALGVPALAEAVTPIHTERTFDVTHRMGGVSGVCGFDVFFRTMGTATATAFLNQDGLVTREIDAGHVTATWFAPSTGGSFSYLLNQPLITDYPGGATLGGPATISEQGFGIKTPSEPASAVHAIFSGSVVGFDASGIPIFDITDLIFISGQPVGPTAQGICAALRGP
jgi:hypothetical protein